MTIPRSARVKELHIEYRPHPSGVRADARQITQPRTAAAILAPMLEHKAEERFLVMLLNTRRGIIAVHEVSRGGIDSCVIDPRIVFRAALLANASSIILAHNHPSGDPSPSPDDLAVTTRIYAAGEILGIQVADHIIIGDQSYCSFKETGRI